MTNGYQPPVQHVVIHQAPRPVTNGMAVAGLVLGIVACAIALVPLLGFVFAPLPALLALIFGIVGLVIASRHGGVRRPSAIAAVVLAVAAPVVMVLSYMAFTTR